MKKLKRKINKVICKILGHKWNYFQYWKEPHESVSKAMKKCIRCKAVRTEHYERPEAQITYKK